MKWICATKIIPAIYLNSFLPNSTPSATAFHRSNPTNLVTLRILWFLRFPIFGGLVVGLNGEGLDLESVQSQQKGKWAEQLGRRWEKKSMLSQCLRLAVKVFCKDSILFFFCKNRFAIAVLGM